MTISNKRAMELTGAVLPCPAIESHDKAYHNAELKVSLRVASMLALADLRAHHSFGAGELDIPEGRKLTISYPPAPMTLSGSSAATCAEAAR